MKKTESLCPHCKKPINLGSLVVQARWADKTDKEKSAIGKKLAEYRHSKRVKKE